MLITAQKDHQDYISGKMTNGPFEVDWLTRGRKRENKITYLYQCKSPRGTTTFRGVGKRPSQVSDQRELFNSCKGKCGEGGDVKDP